MQASQNSMISQIEKKKQIHFSQSISIVHSDFTHLDPTGKKLKPFKFRVILTNLYTGQQGTYQNKKNSLILGRKPNFQEFELDHNNLNQKDKPAFINLSHKSVQSTNHVEITLNPNGKLTFLLKDPGSFNGTYLRVNEQQITLRQMIIIGRSQFFIQQIDIQPKPQITMLINGGPYKGQRIVLNFSKTSYYQIGRRKIGSEQDNQQINYNCYLNLGLDEYIEELHCKISYKEKLQSFFIKGYKSEQGGIWIRLCQARSKNQEPVSAPDNCRLMIGNAYKVNLDWKI